ncbi:WD repeat-containing protein 27 [Caerostris darwini]|uniref:WD repeat-containing protein 27 n=1 Tax=Caerostris darwini TaxID=1538125 RepID=A0AAV4M495_9ARAC|nr:WD repeat-containing protein 27 [Caerostris darwini]
MTNEVYHRLFCPTSMVTHLSVCSENYIAVPLNDRGHIAIWNMNDISQQPFILMGHHKNVTALALSYQPTDYLLCTCSSDNIILWNLIENEGKPTKGKVLHSHMEEAVYCSFSLDNFKIAISFPNGIWIFDLLKHCWVFSIEEIHFTVFTYEYENDVLLGIEDNFLKTWNFKTNEVTTKLSISTGFPTAICVHNKNAIIIIGTSYGHLNIYNKSFNLIRKFYIWKLLAQQLKFDSNEEGIDLKSDNFPIYSIQVCTYKKTKDLENTCFFLLNINNEEVCFFSDFTDDYDIDGTKAPIGLLRSGVVFYNSALSEANVILTPVLVNSLILLKLSLNDVIQSKLTLSNSDTDDEKHVLTFLSSDHAEKGESLLISKIKKTKPKKNSKKAISALNLPVTFHSNIKSSGYGNIQKSVKLFQPQIPKRQGNRIKSSMSFEKKQNNTDMKQKDIYDQYKSSFHFDKFELHSSIRLSYDPIISSLHATVDGQYVCSPSSDGLIEVLKLEKKQFKMFHTLRAHKGKAIAAKWSHSNKLLITIGNDKMAKLWDLGKQHPLLTIGVDADEATNMRKNKFVFEDEIELVQFYYLDHFLLAAAGNNVYLFEYVINIEKSNIKSFENKSYFKLVKKIPLDTKRITSLAAMNQLFSNILFLN